MYGIETGINSDLNRQNSTEEINVERRVRTKTISRLVWRISERTRALNSSSVAPSNRLGLVNGVDDFRLFVVWDCGDVGIGERVRLSIDDIGGSNGEDEGEETTFITGEIIALLDDVGVNDDWVSVSVIILEEIEWN